MPRRSEGEPRRQAGRRVRPEGPANRGERPSLSTPLEIGEPFGPIVRPLPKGSDPVVFQDGDIHIDENALQKEVKRVNEWLRNGVLEGDEHVFEVYRRNIAEYGEEGEVLMEQLIEAFQKRDPGILGLKSITLNLPTEEIAQRNLIRDRVRRELARHPFTFRNQSGESLSSDDIDWVYSRSEKNPRDFKFIIGSKRGIDSIAWPQELDATPFQPDKEKLDRKEDVFVIPLKPSLEGTAPAVAIVEVRKGPVDIVEEIQEAERRERLEEERRWAAQQAAAQQAAAQQARQSPSLPFSGGGGRWSRGG